jgi:gamma-tubulin complex component 5
VESSNSEQEDDEEYGMEPPSFIGDTTISFAEEDAFTRVGKMSKELDGLIRFVRRGVENLGSKGGPESSTFGVLSFALEDWDR